MRDHAIVLFSHGSLLCGSAQRLHEVAQQMRAHAEGRIVEIGFLNYTEPSFETAIERCVSQGASAVTVAPYFLAAGKFVTTDLPPKIAWAKRTYPQLELLVAEPLRRHPALAEALLHCADRAAPPDQWRDLLKTAPRFCEARSNCPLFGGELCPASATGVIEQRLVSVHRLEEGASLAPHLVPTALLVMVHGSPRAESNDDMFEVVAEVRRREKFDCVEVGFLECNEPSIAVALDRCVESGAAQVVAVPYFLHPGRHVADDLPGLLEAAQLRHTAVEFLMGDYLGHDPAIAEAILDRARDVG